MGSFEQYQDPSSPASSSGSEIEREEEDEVGESAALVDKEGEKREEDKGVREGQDSKGLW